MIVENFTSDGESSGDRPEISGRWNVHTSWAYPCVRRARRGMCPPAVGRAGRGSRLCVVVIAPTALAKRAISGKWRSKSSPYCSSPPSSAATNESPAPVVSTASTRKPGAVKRHAVVQRRAILTVSDHDQRHAVAPEGPGVSFAGQEFEFFLAHLDHVGVLHAQQHPGFRGLRAWPQAHAQVRVIGNQLAAVFGAAPHGRRVADRSARRSR